MVYNNWYFKDLPINEREKLVAHPLEIPERRRKFECERMAIQRKALKSIPSDKKVGIKALNDRMIKANKEKEEFTREEFIQLIETQKQKINDYSVPKLLYFFNIHFGSSVLMDKDQKKYVTSTIHTTVNYNQEKDSFIVTYEHLPETTLKEFCVLSVLESQTLNKVTDKLLEKLKESEGSFALIKKRGEFGEELPFLLLVHRHDRIVRFNLKIDDAGLATLTAKNITHDIFLQNLLQIKYGPDELIKVLTELGCHKRVTSEDV